jgi:hypothetical protein
MRPLAEAAPSPVETAPSPAFEKAPSQAQPSARTAWVASAVRIHPEMGKEEGT